MFKALPRSLSLLATLIAFSHVVVAQDGSEDNECLDAEFIRTIDGSCNNLDSLQAGSAHTPLSRLFSNSYDDEFSSLAQMGRPNPRVVSNMVFSQGQTSIPNSLNATDMVWQFGQFLDHDLDLSELHMPSEDISIPVLAGDSVLDPQSTGNQTLRMSRSDFIEDDSGVRQQVNALTSWIDGSQVYGSTSDRTATLRRNDGSGQLLVFTSEYGDLLPLNNCAGATDNFEYRVSECLPNENAHADESSLFVGGDVRVNEQAGLIAMHTLFMREHNYQASQCSSAVEDVQKRDDEIFECARRRVIAELQKITFYDFLPLLLGDRTPEAYQQYDPAINPSISNEFATASYRFGHSALSAQILRIDSEGREMEDGHLGLRDAFFCVDCIINQGGVEPLLRGLAAQPHQEVDALVVDDVRNFLFRMPSESDETVGEDLISRNIQRGREHGIPSYTEARRMSGLSPVNSFEDIPTSPETRERLRMAYNGNVHAIDFWVGALAEQHVRNGLLGELNAYVVREQFVALRDGDRFWFENPGILSDEELQQTRDTTLATIIRRNSAIGNELPENVFVLNGNSMGSGGTTVTTSLLNIAVMASMAAAIAR